MSDEIKSAFEQHSAAIDAAMSKFEGQLAEQGRVDTEVKAEVKALSEKFESTITEIAQKLDSAKDNPQVKMTAGAEFVKSEEFQALAAGKTKFARIEVKNTILGSPTTTTSPDYRPGVVGGPFRPLSIRDVMPQFQTNTDLVVLTREASFTNNAAEVAQGVLKPESAITFNKYNVPVETVAHWLKVSKQLTQDAPAVISYIENRLKWGVEARIDTQLLVGNGTSPNISGLMDAGNFTVYTPVAADSLVKAINRAKYQLWAIGYVPDTVIVNPADWGAQEIATGTDGHFLYGLPGMASGMNPFGLRIVISAAMPAGQFLVGNFSIATGVWNREGTTIEMGYVDDDFTRNLITMLAEARLGLEVSVPAALLGGPFTV